MESQVPLGHTYQEGLPLEISSLPHLHILFHIFFLSACLFRWKLDYHNLVLYHTCYPFKSPQQLVHEEQVLDLLDEDGRHAVPSKRLESIALWGGVIDLQERNP